MEMVPVTSSNIEAVGYDPKTQTLRVDFLNGTSYEYEGVLESVYTNLLSAGSVGSYFNANVRSRYSYVQV